MPPPPAADGSDGTAPQDYSVEALYSQLSDGGFDYGRQFQALESVSVRSARAAAGTVAHRESPFALDFVDVDVCFHITPLVSSLGFQGAPVRIARVQCFARSPPGTAALQVRVTEAAAGIDFQPPKTMSA